MGKWNYIAKISEILGVNNNFTIDLLNRYDKPNVQELTNTHGASPWGCLTTHSE